MMHRNLDRRVEALVRMPASDLVERIDNLLTLSFDENTAAWILGADGEWSRNSGTIHLQEELIARQRRQRRGQ
jgi:polyphosphate kinase